MEIQQLQRNNSIVVTLIGDFVTTSVTKVEDMVQPTIERVIKTTQLSGVLFDFDDVRFLDSSAIGWICKKLVSLRRENKKLVIARLGKNTKDVLQTAGLLNLISVYSSIEEALEDM